MLLYFIQCFIITLKVEYIITLEILSPQDCYEGTFNKVLLLSFVLPRETVHFKHPCIVSV